MKIDIKRKVEEKGLNPYRLGVLIGVTYPTIRAIYYGNVTSVKFDILEKICKVLECTPNDILVFDKEDTEH